jgi:hypothetical protein
LNALFLVIPIDPCSCVYCMVRTAACSSGDFKRSGWSSARVWYSIILGTSHRPHRSAMLFAVAESIALRDDFGRNPMQLDVKTDLARMLKGREAAVRCAAFEGLLSRYAGEGFSNLILTHWPRMKSQRAWRKGLSENSSVKR